MPQSSLQRDVSSIASRKLRRSAGLNSPSPCESTFSVPLATLRCLALPSEHPKCTGLEWLAGGLLLELWAAPSHQTKIEEVRILRPLSIPQKDGSCRLFGPRARQLQTIPRRKRPPNFCIIFMMGP